MAAHAFFLTAMAMMALLLFLLRQLEFLAPYRSLFLHFYLTQISLYFGALAINLFAGFYLLTRVLFLKDTGSKLAHLEKQLRSGASPSDELSRRLGG